MDFVDLHVHSNRSDGTYSPSELVDYAIKKGLSAIALTDHDTVDGIDEILEYAKDKPIEVIAGIEYSTQYNERDVHIVGLFVDYKAPAFLEYLERFKQSRTDRNLKLCNNLRKAGIDITYEGLQKAYPDCVITRAHYAAYLLDKGYVKSRNEAFDRYLGDHTPYFVHREKVTPEEVIEVTLKSGGIPILAHPTLYRLGDEQLDILVKRLKKAGLMGIETMYCTYTQSDEKRIKALADKYNLLYSGGSDFHGRNKPGLDLGTGYGKLHVKKEFLDDMKRARQKKILFSDIDGTLLSDEKKIDADTRLKIIEMISRGNDFCLASGRPISSIFDVLKSIDIVDEVKALHKAHEHENIGGIYATAYNGALLYDCLEDKPVEEYSVPIQTAQRIFDMARESKIHMQTYSDTHIIAIDEGPELAFYKRNVVMPHKVATRLEDDLTHAPFKLIAIELDDKSRLEAFRDRVEASDIGGEITCAFSNDRYLEFYSKEAGKGNGLVNMCRYLNILPQNSIAAGDEENDISMLKAAGTGVCMANGKELVKDIADYVTKADNNNGGIGEVIEKFIFLK
jgi:Cof subfamily protein (haloacid dehalogenase superfamily)